MKKGTLILLLISSLFSYSQFNPNAPWLSNDANVKEKEISIDAFAFLFNEYWKTHDKNKKGSGYKPFMRWEYHWRNKTNPEGFVITPQEMWSALQQKQSRKNNKNFNSVLVPDSNWEPVGPFTHTNTGSWSSGQGRVNVIQVDPNNPNTLYLGAPAGGIWKSTNGGNSWIPLSDNLPQIGVSGIAIDPTNSNTIYISTGDCDGSDTYSIGVMKSTDGGLSWATTGLTFTSTNKFSGDIIINPTNSNMLWVATNDGIYKTTNAGVNWSLVQSGNFSQGRIRLKPNDPNTVYAVSEDKFYRSTNAGSSFVLISSGLPPSSGRMLLDVTPANSNYVYILSATTINEFQGIYRSIDGGTSWSEMSNGTDVFESPQAWYDLAFAVSPTNANELYTGCLNVWKSTDGGATVAKLNSWSSPANQAYTHADIHYLQFFGNKLYCGSDGGIYVSEDQGASFTDKTASAQISQFYKIAVSKQTASKMVGGLQDNGGHAYSNSQWKNYYGADGMDTAVDPNNSNLFYGFIQNGGNLYISSNGGNSLSGSVDSPSGEDGNWVTPLAINATGELFSGYNNLYVLSSGQWQQRNASTIWSNNIELIAIDPSNDNIMYVSNGTDLYKSTNSGVNFNVIYAASSNITSIDVHSTNSNIVYITTSGTSGQALKSIDGGVTFSSINSGLPNIGKNIIVHQGRNPNNPLYVGTSLGVYYRDDTMSQWEPFDTNLPNVAVTDLEINLEDEKIIAATYGRGIWQSSIPITPAPNDIKLIAVQNPSTTNINCGNNITPQVLVKNNGQNNITSVTFNYTVNSTPYNYLWTGTITPSNTATIDLPLLALPQGTYSMSVNSTITDDAYNDNNTATTSFSLNQSGMVNTLNTFENTTDELLEYDEGATYGIWTRGIRTGGALATGINNVYATSLSGNYPNSKKSYLVSRCYDLSVLSSPQISFKMAFDLEENWDILYVEYSTNFGQTWQVLGQMGSTWYNSDRTPETTGDDCINCVGAQWTGTDLVFKTYSYPLVALNTETNVIFRLVFQSDQTVNEQGVIIDDFLINGTLSNETFSLNKVTVFPNPSTGIYHIATGTSLEKIEVYDLTGKNITTINNLPSNNNYATINLSSVSKGIYFLKITSNNQTIVKRIIKN